MGHRSSFFFRITGLDIVNEDTYVVKDPTDQVLSDPDPTGQVLTDSDPDGYTFSDPGGSGSETLMWAIITT